MEKGDRDPSLQSRGQPRRLRLVRPAPFPAGARARRSGSSRGFTLIELLLVVAVAVVLLAVGAPAMVDMILNNRMTSQANELLADFAYARSQSASMGVRVTACVSSDGASCTGAAWNQGRIVFADTDGNGAYGAGDQILRVTSSLSGGNTVAVAGLSTATAIQFRPSGIAAGLTGSSATFKLCDTRTGADVGRTVTVALTGRASVARTACP